MIFTTKFFRGKFWRREWTFYLKKEKNKKKNPWTRLICALELSIVNAEAPSTQASSFIYFARRNYKIVNEIFESIVPRTQTNSLQYLRWAVIIVIKLFYIYL